MYFGNVSDFFYKTKQWLNNQPKIQLKVKEIQNLIKVNNKYYTVNDLTGELIPANKEVNKTESNKKVNKSNIKELLPKLTKNEKELIKERIKKQKNEIEKKNKRNILKENKASLNTFDDIKIKSSNKKRKLEIRSSREKIFDRNRVEKLINPKRKIKLSAATQIILNKNKSSELLLKKNSKKFDSLKTRKITGIEPYEENKTKYNNINPNMKIKYNITEYKNNEKCEDDEKDDSILKYFYNDDLLKVQKNDSLIMRQIKNDLYINQVNKELEKKYQFYHFENNKFNEIKIPKIRINNFKNIQGYTYFTQNRDSLTHKTYMRHIKRFSKPLKTDINETTTNKTVSKNKSNDLINFNKLNNLYKNYKN